MTTDDSIGRLDDDDYPAYTMGRAAEMLGTTPAFLRAIGEARLITPLRSEGGHRRYSRYQLRIAARAREIVDQGTPIDVACRIVILEDQLEEAQRLTPNTADPQPSSILQPQRDVRAPASTRHAPRSTSLDSNASDPTRVEAFNQGNVAGARPPAFS